MKWNKFRLKTTAEAEDIVSSMLMDLGIQGVEGIHLYTMNDPDVARRISQAVENLREG